MARFTGQVVQVMGGVVDVEFPIGQLPNVYEALEITREGQLPLILEVEKHLGNNWVRCVAMDLPMVYKEMCLFIRWAHQ